MVRGYRLGRDKKRIGLAKTLGDSYWIPACAGMTS